MTLPASATVEQAAKKMRDDDIGDVIVMDGGRVFGIVTDRDIVVRAMAEGRDSTSTPIREICTNDLVTMSPGDDVKKAIEVMKERAIRRIPVCQDGNPVGVVSIGDLAIESHGERALADISAAAPNNSSLCALAPGYRHERAQGRSLEASSGCCARLDAPVVAVAQLG